MTNFQFNVMIVFLCFFLFPMTSQRQFHNVSTLKFVYVIARHGTRAPTVSFPLDKYPVDNPRYWPEGPGQLTSVGKRQAYQIGVNLRQRYDEFLSPYYLENETRVSSNPYTRDMMSAQLLAAGLYPPFGEQIWNPSLLWQPLPVWIDSFDVADITSRGVCPRFDALQDAAYDNSYSTIYLPNEEFMTLVQNLTGRPSSHIRGIKNIYDALEIQKEHGFKSPAWATTEFMARLFDISSKQYKIHVAGLPDMNRLTAGPVLEKIVDEFTSQKRKFVVLMSHDNTIFTVAQALGLTDFPMPQMASYLVLEVHAADFNSSDAIQAYYFENSAITTPTLLDIPACGHPCLVDSFIRAAQRLMPDDWEKECGLRSSSIKILVPSLTTILAYFFLNRSIIL